MCVEDENVMAAKTFVSVACYLVLPAAPISDFAATIAGAITIPTNASAIIRSCIVVLPGGLCASRTPKYHRHDWKIL